MSWYEAPLPTGVKVTRPPPPGYYPVLVGWALRSDDDCGEDRCERSRPTWAEWQAEVFGGWGVCELSATAAFRSRTPLPVWDLGVKNVLLLYSLDSSSVATLAKRTVICWLSRAWRTMKC